MLGGCVCWCVYVVCVVCDVCCALFVGYGVLFVCLLSDVWRVVRVVCCVVFVFCCVLFVVWCVWCEVCWLTRVVGVCWLMVDA